MSRVFLGLIALGFGTGAAAQTYETLNSTLVDAVVVPAYRNYADTIKPLLVRIEELCENPTQGLEMAQQVWREATLAWQHAQPIGFGPVSDRGLGPQIAFWPDKHGTAGRQLSRALADRDLSLRASRQLEGKSVGLTSMATLERLLFGKAMVDPDLRDYACAYGLAVARHQVDLAAGLALAWTVPGGYRETVVGAGAGNEVFFSAYDPTVALFRSIADTLDNLIQVKLEAPLGTNAEKARGKRAENWRSEMALAGVVANLETARALYGTPGGFADLFAVLGGDPAVDERVSQGFEGAISAARAIPLPLAEAVSDRAPRRQVGDLVDRLKALRALIRGPVASELGLSIGFNATDGD